MSDKFRSTKYKPLTKTIQHGDHTHERDVNWADVTDGYGNVAEMMVSFYHVPSGESIYFKAFITAFNETYSSDWGRESIYGRTDPVYLFKSTKRQVSLVLKVPASTASEAYENLGRVQKLTQFLYPVYVKSDSTTTIGQSPLIRLKVMNLLARQPNLSIRNKVIDKDKTTHDMYYTYASTSEPTKGLLGIIRSLAVNHNLENPEIGIIEKATNTILPKMIEINLEFAAIHEQPLGWTENGTPASPLFPYGVKLTDKVPEDPKDKKGASASPAAIITEANKQKTPPPKPEIPDEPAPKPPNQATQDGAKAHTHNASNKVLGDRSGEIMTPLGDAYTTTEQAMNTPMAGMVSRSSLLDALNAELARIESMKTGDEGLE